ncbi:hypothetical protein AB6A40_001248 [Gnathostoma spinigerum]|uniref:Mannosyltransferase n=1 Tax=Gnathostoma spinigerum TaxID=75299 RepID=A0ABD6EB16_9BILA
MHWRSILLFVLFRLLNLFLIRTWFVPDEIFQSVEVAHASVFGIGTLTWEWTHSLRSVFHPFVISLLFRFLRFFSLDTNFAIILFPRLLHSLLFAFADLFFLKLAIRFLPTLTAAKYALFSYMSCWFIWYCAPRTLSNNLEMILTLIALNWYPFSLSRKSSSCQMVWPYMTVGVVTIFIRPTAVLFWVPLGLWHLWRVDHPFMLLYKTCLPSMLPVLAISILLDSFIYHRFTITIWNFAKFNVFEGGSGHFGVHPWHWYISQGLPLTFGVQLIAVAGGLLLVLKQKSVSLLPFLLSVWYILFHSCLAHKEHRFVLPIMPLMCLYAGNFLARSAYRRLFVFLILAFNIPLALYSGLFHQIGPCSAVKELTSMLSSAERRSENSSTLVLLMPCYSLPHYSYFHGFNVSFVSLDCSPNLDHIVNYVDESDSFHNDPVFWMLSNRSKWLSATYLIMYEKSFRKVEELLKSEAFFLCSVIFHAHFLTSVNQDHFIVIASRLCSDR